MWVACRRRARILLAAVALVGVVAVVPALAGVSEVDRSTSASGPGDKSKPTASGPKSQAFGLWRQVQPGRLRRQVQAWRLLVDLNLYGPKIRSPPGPDVRRLRMATSAGDRREIGRASCRE